MAMAMQELRRSSATDRKSIADYRRRIKHDESGWE